MRTSQLMTGRSGKGTVFLVGASVGAEDLITVRGLDLIKKADIIFYDALLPHSLLGEAKQYAELVNCGKRSGKHTLSQDEILVRLYESAKNGLLVVRLKGGDPMIYGRGGEEAIYLTERGIPVEIIPGVSSLQVCSASAGIPLTHRGVSNSFIVLSGDSVSLQSVDFHFLAKFTGTIVFFMARNSMPQIFENLVANGMPHSKPIAWIEAGGTTDQRVQISVLSRFGSIVPDPGLPGLLVIGETISLSDQILTTGVLSSAVSGFL